MIRISTQSRLHFGLFSLPSESATAWLNQDGEPTIPRRQFGGVGLMIDEPGIELTLEEAEEWSADGPLAERALQFAKVCSDSFDMRRAFHLHVVSAAPEHFGLGTGTQLGLAIAYALQAIARKNHINVNALHLAKIIGRGLRSHVGIHGFERGGLVVEAGKSADSPFSPLVAHHGFPTEWSILLIMPRDLQGIHGSREVNAFAHLKTLPADGRATESLCRLVLLGMLPALVERDLDTFGEALYDFNRRVGKLFQTAQGGLYAHPRVEQIVKCLREMGVKGVGQSSWGPATFAVVHGALADEVREQLVNKGTIDADEAIITRSGNPGYTTLMRHP
jgi:beta-ribofuranosylaminobenzene 5'-phosphate synthase